MGSRKKSPRKIPPKPNPNLTLTLTPYGGFSRGVPDTVTVNGDGNIFYTYFSALNNYKQMLPFSDNLVPQHTQFFMAKKKQIFLYPKYQRIKDWY